MTFNGYTEATLASALKSLPHFLHVKIDFDALEMSAKENARGEFPLPRWDFDGVHPRSNTAFVSHCFWANAINFCFDHSSKNGDGKIATYKTTAVNGKEISGSYGMEACFYRAFGENPILAEDILRITASRKNMERFFAGSAPMPMLEERRELLLEAAEVLLSDFGGNPANILKEAGFLAFAGNDRRHSPGVVNVLISLFKRSFGGDFLFDSSGIMFGVPSLRFIFNKRVQLFALTYHGRASQSGGELAPLADAHKIGPIADYILPKRYAENKIFTYSPELQEKVDRALPVDPSSAMEVEIRAATIIAQAKELEIINRERRAARLDTLHIGHVDFYRWAKRSKTKLNHHICYTTNY